MFAGLLIPETATAEERKSMAVEQNLAMANLMTLLDSLKVIESIAKDPSHAHRKYAANLLKAAAWPFMQICRELLKCIEKTVTLWRKGDDSTKQLTEFSRLHVAKWQSANLPGARRAPVVFTIHYKEWPDTARENVKATEINRSVC